LGDTTGGEDVEELEGKPKHDEEGSRSGVEG